MLNKNKHKVSLIVTIISILLFGAVAYAEADTTPPSDVSSVVANAGDKVVNLSWEAATDDIAVTGYRIYYGLDAVTAEGGSYMFQKDLPNTLKVTIDELENDVSYYFAITALDAVGNESAFYSVEVSATPSSSTINEATTEDTLTDTEDNVTEPPKEEPASTPEDQNQETAQTQESQEQEQEQVQNQPQEQTQEPQEQVADLIAPVLADFVAKIENEKNVRLSWKIANETVASLADQILYQSEDGKTFGSGKSLGDKVREYLISNLVPGKTYTFKLTAKDAKGKETDGIISSVTLPQTGAGLASLIAASLGLAGYITKKRK
jgi:hypothetical protein